MQAGFRHNYLLMTKGLQQTDARQVCEPPSETSIERAALEEKFRAESRLPCWSEHGVLTSRQIVAIRELVRQDPDGWTLRKLAAMFGCSTWIVARVLNRKFVAVRPPTREEFGL